MTGALGRDAAPRARPKTVLRRQAALTPLAGLYVVSRLLGLGREIGIASQFGASSEADALGVALAVASVGGILLGEAVYATSIRVLNAVPEQQRLSAFIGLLASVRVVAFLGATGFTVIGPLIVVLLLGRAGLELLFTTALLCVAVAANVVVAAYNAYLTVQQRFGLQAAVQILYSLGALVAIALMVGDVLTVKPYVVAAGWSAGNLAAVIVLRAAVPARPHGARERARPWQVLRPGLPVTGAYAFLGLQTFLAHGMAARSDVGAVAALVYADRLFLLPIGFAMAVLGPIALGAVAAGSSGPERATTALDQVRVLTSGLVPVTLLFTAVGPWLVRIVYERGAFSPAARTLTTSALDGLAVGIGAVALSLVLLRMMQAVTPPKATLHVTAVATAGFVVMAAPLTAALGVFGTTLSLALSALLTVGLQVARLGFAFGAVWRRSATVNGVAPILAVTIVCLAVVALDRGGHLDATIRAALLTAFAFAACLFGAYRIVGRRP